MKDCGGPAPEHQPGMGGSKAAKSKLAPRTEMERAVHEARREKKAKHRKKK